MQLPFDLPAVSRGFAALDAGARAVGRDAAAAAARALAEVLGAPVAIAGRPLPGDPRGGTGAGRLSVELPALPGGAQLEVEPALVARLVDAVAGGAGQLAGAAALTPLEEAALELLVLVALDGLALVPAVAERLAPRLVASTATPRSPLLVELEVTTATVRGRAWLHLPGAAVEALADPAVLPEPLLAFPVFASLQAGQAPLLPEELAELSPGDVVLLDPPPGERQRLVFPGGFTVEGPVTDDALVVDDSAPAGRLAEIPLRLDVELARVPLTLADVARIAPGATLPLHLDRRGLVTLRLGERAVARGELVEVDGAVGVRVLSLEGSP
jgi:type III secretion protein Q